MSLAATTDARRQSIAVRVGQVTVGGRRPVVVQSMTNTDTADVEGTARQVAALARAGSELVRITVDRDEAAAAVPHIKERLRQMGVDVPLVGDFHYIGHKLLADHPACAEALDKYRINPGNVGFKEKKDRQFSAIVETAIKHGKPVRIGANWGSLDQELLTHLMDENARSPQPIDAREVTREAMVQSALLSAARAEEIGLPRNRIILSAKVSAVQDLIAVYADLARRSDYALHLGLTEAGMGSKGIVASSAAMGVLLQQGIGDTIRISLTPEPGGDRTLEVQGRRRSCCRPWASAPSCRWSRPAPAAAAPPRPRSRSSRRTSRASSAPRCRNGRRDIRASRRSTSRSWAASSTARARASMPISASRCPAPARRRPRRSSSTARRPRRCAARRRGRFQADGDRLYRAPLRHGAGRPHRGGVNAGQDSRLFEDPMMSFRGARMAREPGIHTPSTDDYGKTGVVDFRARDFVAPRNDREGGAHTLSPFSSASAFSDVSGRAPRCWITSAAAMAPRRAALT